MTGVSAMIRLIGAELNRLRSRRVTMWTMIVVVVAMGLFQLEVHSLASPPTGAQLAANQQAYQEAVQQYQTQHDQEVADCLQSGQSQSDCDYPPPTPADFSMLPTPFSETAQTVSDASPYLAMLASFLVGASFIGAEYSSGSLANWLTFVPRRLRVYLSKAAAIAIFSAALGAVVAFTLAGLAALQTHAYGQPVTGAGHLAAASGRVVVLSAVAGLIGFGLALVSRHTVAALGVPLAYGIVDTVVQVLTYDASSPLHWLPPYLVQSNVRAFVDHGTTYQQAVETVTANGTSYDYVDKVITFVHSGVYWLVVAAIALVVPAIVFRRRDVT